MMKISIKTIIFDLGNVIVYHDNRLLYGRLSKFSNLSPEKVKGKLKDGFLNKMDQGKYESIKFFEKIKNLLNLEISYDEFKDVWSSHFSRNPQMEELINSLKNSYELMILSNTNELHYNYLEENYPILDVFDSNILSFEVGIRKPDKGIYRKALENTDSKPNECIFTDNKKEYVEAAEQLGIKGFHFKNLEGFKKDLDKNGIKI